MEIALTTALMNAGAPAALVTAASYAGTAASVLSTGGSILSGLGAMQQGKAANAEAKYQAAQMEQNAGQEQASSQRAAAEQRRKARFAQSKLKAQAAAGGSVSDPTIVSLSGQLAEEGEYAALTELYGGSERAAGLYNQAAATRLSGKTKRQSGYMKGASLLAGGSSLFSKYADGGFNG